MPTSVHSPVTPRSTIADASRGYKAGFYWLAPMVSSPSTTGTFDPTVSPTVSICQLAGDACAASIVTYTMTSGAGSETLLVSIYVLLLDAMDARSNLDLSNPSTFRLPGATLARFVAPFQPPASGADPPNPSGCPLK